MRFCVFVFAAVFCVHPALAQGEWPDWRGPKTDGHSDAAGLPLKWSETENVVWKTAIHDFGFSTPVIWGKLIWLTTSKEDGTALYAVGVDCESGKVIYDIEVFHVESPQRINPNNTHATPSPCIEEGRVYVHFGTSGTACIDTASGEVLWRRTDLNCDHMQGPASSPVIFEDLLIIHLEGKDKQFIVALNKTTGETVWTYNRPADLYTPDIQGVYLKSYQTPVFVEINGQVQMISNGALLVTGHNPRTGEELWRVRYRDDSTISRIVWGNGLLFVNTGGSPGATQLWAIREGGVGDVTDTHVVWKMTEDTPHQSSPVLVGDLLYMVSDLGVLICMEAATGNRVWSQQMDGKFGASLLAVPDRIYVSNMKGTTTVIAPGREYRELAVNQLDDGFWASPAVTGNALVLRTKTHLYRIEEAK
ncbi:MAG: PQQ-binding-like beta-propeller repeat protein [Candidatus Hydrogenedentes bacterium]|nr:PQQ-binding-like beta-propeller repeat protein [Candidatus Hydrogenedentota bacterium]